MHAHRLRTAIVAALATAGVIVATVPSWAQAPGAQPLPPTAVVKKKPTQVAMTGRPPARLTVRKRSYLDPGTETKAGAEHYQDYAFPPGGSHSYTADPNDFKINWTRMPFPSCFDLAGFCR
jgi:hypothetical protein